MTAGRGDDTKLFPLRGELDPHTGIAAHGDSGAVKHRAAGEGLRGAEAGAVQVSHGNDLLTGAQVGGEPENYDPEAWGITVLGPGAVIAAGETVKPNTMLNAEHKEVSR